MGEGGREVITATLNLLSSLTTFSLSPSSELRPFSCWLSWSLVGFLLKWNIITFLSCHLYHKKMWVGETEPDQRHAATDDLSARTYQYVNTVRGPSSWSSLVSECLVLYFLNVKSKIKSSIIQIELSKTKEKNNTDVLYWWVKIKVNK